MIFETEFFINLDDEIFHEDFNAGSKENLPKVFRMYFDNYLKGNAKPTETVVQTINEDEQSKEKSTEDDVEVEKLDVDEDQ